MTILRRIGMLWWGLTALPKPPPLKVCACGEQYDKESWAALKRHAIQAFEGDDSPVVTEYRVCRRCNMVVGVAAIIIYL